jgi:hypothetical protein
MLRLMTLVAGALAALALAGSAFAAFTPRMVVSQNLAAGGAQPTTIHVNVAQTDDAAAVAQIYVPTGYSIASSAPGTNLGAASGTVFARDVGLTLPLDGTVIADDPANHTADPCAPGTHFAVWVLNLSVAGNTIALPVYVDPTAGAETAFGAYKLRTCFGPPDVPPGTPGRSPNGAQLLDASFTVNSAITAPTAPARYVWRALLTPWTPGTGVPNVAGTVEARSFVDLPGAISLSASYVRKSNSYRLSGTVKAGGTAVGGAKVDVYRGRTAKVAKAGSTTTKAGGTYSVAGKLTPKKTTFFQTRATGGGDDYPAGCTAAGLAPAPVPCATATLGGWSAVSRVISIRP